MYNILMVIAVAAAVIAVTSSSNTIIRCKKNNIIVLCPPLDNNKLQVITWKFGQNKIAEYDLFNTITYYKEFNTNKKTKLNITTGCLTMMATQSRQFKSETQINNKLIYHLFNIKVYSNLTLSVVTSNQTTDDNCSVICKADPDEDVVITWTNTIGEHITNVSQLGITDKDVICMGSNPVENSSITVNLNGLCQFKEPPAAGATSYLIGSAVLLVLTVGVTTGVILIYNNIKWTYKTRHRLPLTKNKRLVQF
ncbi:protein ORF127 [Lake sturgeon herpesvirus]|nr:protein ORF127 [Lake sturgeon herpesvirus]